MRVTNSMLVHNALVGVRQRLADLAKAQERATTLAKVNTMSDDPVAGAQLARIGSSLRDIDQWKKNATQARTMLSAEDVALTSMSKLLQQAREIATGVSQLSAVDPMRQQALSQLGDIQKQLVALGNTRVGDQYLFGGTRTTTPPFLDDGTYVGDSSVRQVEIDDGVTVGTTHAGDHSVGGALLSLTTLEQSVATEAAPEIATSVADLQAYEDQLLTDQAEVGARLQSIATSQSSLASRANSALDLRDATNLIDPAQALVEVQTSQTALERAYAVVGRVLQTNILDFLK